MAFTTPKNTEFLPAEDTAKAYVMLDGETAATVDVAYGLLMATSDHDKPEGEVLGSRYRLTTSVEVMGNDVTVEVGAATFPKAVDALMGEAVFSSGEFELWYDEDSDYFKQKYTAPKADDNDVWGNPKFKEVRGELETLRGDAEGVLADLSDNQTKTQASAVELAQVLRRVFELCGKSRKALAKWAQGSKDSGNMPMLSQMGKGANALYEAMRFADLTDAELACLPNSITSGKGLDNMARVSIKQVVEEHKVHACFASVDVTGDVPTIEGVEVMVRKFIGHAVPNIDDLSIADGLDVFMPKLDAYVANFVSDYGKNANMYDNGEAKEARRAYAYARISDKGRGILNDTLTLISDYQADLSEDKGEDAAKRLRSAFSATGGNALLKEMWAAVKAHAAAVAKEKETKKVADTLESDEVQNAKVDTKSWPELDVATAAAALYQRIGRHGKPNEVAKILKDLLAAHPFEAPNDKRDDDTSDH